MDPVLQRLGDVTIQRLQKPKVGPPVDTSPLEKPRESQEESYSEAEEESEEELPNHDPKKSLISEEIHIPGLRKPLPADELSVSSVKRPLQGPLPTSEVAVKKFKFNSGDITLEKKCDDFNNFSEAEISDYDSESEMEESDGELNEINTPGNTLSAKVNSVSTPAVKETSEDEASSSASFFEKLVEQVEAPSSSTTPVRTELPADEEYDIDIKEKLKEMGEISFETVKKGEPKPKKPEVNTENEVVVTPAKRFGADGEELPPSLPKGIALRRNIREVMDETKLDESTLAAQRQEAERLRRVQEQQRLLRELQRQAAQERMQNKVMAMLQGNQFSRPGTSAQQQTRIGNTVLVKLPNGQTKSMTRIPKRPFELVRINKNSVTPPMPAPGIPKNRSLLQNRKPPGGDLTPSVSIAPVGRKGPLPPGQLRRHSDSDSETEERRMLSPPSGLIQQRPPKLPGKQPVQTIDISSDDDCIVVSEPEGEDENEPDDDPTNSGMHTNDSFNQPDAQGRVLVNVGHPEDEPDIFVAPQIARVIKPHQIGGVRFLYDNVIESISRFESSSGFGCILAHSMGLGKTLQIVTFSDIFLRHTPGKTILCIMPINTLQNWLAEFNMWVPIEGAVTNSPLIAHGEVRPRNFGLHVLNDSHKTLVARAKVIHEWRSKGGVLLIGYEQFRLLSLRKFPKSRKKMNAMEAAADEDKTRVLFDEVHTALVKPGPDLVICDEGHRIKNSHASISQALKQMETKRRVVLTGYPLQNNLMEYWCMVDFVRPNYLGSKTEFCNMFERPIMNGQCIDSTEADIKLMRYRAHVLHSLLLGFVQRRSHAVLQMALPQKEEYVLLLRMTPFQRTLYETFMNEVVRIQTVPNPLKAFAVCCKIWNHPDVLYNFLKKRAGGEAVDIDLEEVGSVAMSKAPLPEKSPKKPPAKPRKTPAKGKNGKPAASVTPYNTSTDVNQMQPPAIPASSSDNQNNTNSSLLTSFANTISQGKDNMASSFSSNSTFPDIPQSFPEPIPQPYYDQEFDQNAQFPSSFPNSSNNYSYPSTPTSNTNFNTESNFNISAQNQEQPPTTNQDFLNLDTQRTSLTSITTTSHISSFANLPSGISLTPLKPKKDSTINSSSLNPVPTTQSTTLTPLSTTTGSALASLHTENYEELDITSPNQNNPGYEQNNLFNHGEFGEHFNHQNSDCPEFQPEFWQNESNFFGPPNNSFNPNTITGGSGHSWIKKEDVKPTLSSLISPKSETSSDSKPKINIISDIKLPPVFTTSSEKSEKKIKILSDIKIEPKMEIKEEFEEKPEVKMEIGMFKQEVKVEEEPKLPVNDNPFAKMNPLALRDSKEDSGIPYDWAIELLKDYKPGFIENSGKMEILFCIIRESIALGDRLLLFSQSLITLDLIEQFLQMNDVPGDTVKWAKNTSYCRLDGSTSALEREKLINEFNSNPKIHLFLVSTRAGSLGINLVGANRVVVLDASWNPCHDTQAVCRVYRYGQRKPCFVYRLVVDNCLEKKIYDRQINKQGMSDRVVDECNPDAHLTMKDVSTLCWDDKRDEGELKDWSYTKDNYIDVVLQKVLEKHGKLFSKEPFQHESLLVDRKEKQLSQQEKRLAKKGYEREKQAARQPMYNMLGSSRGHRPVASVRPMQQGERPSRWIPAEHWQRQGMTAQEMTLPLDVVIPTNQPEKGNIVLKAGQKVLVLKSPKGVYMQLESGKIVAIKTAIKVKGKADEGSDPSKMAKPPQLPPSMKNNPSLSVMPQKRPPVKPFIPGQTKFGIQSVKQNVPNLVSRIRSIQKKLQGDKTPKKIHIGSEIAKSLARDKDGEHLPMSSSDEEHQHEKSKQESADEIQKKISLLKKNISIQRVTSQPKSQLPPPQAPAPPIVEEKGDSSPDSTALEQLENASMLNEDTPFQDTLDSITNAYQATNDDNFEDFEDEISDPSDAKHQEQSEASDQSDEVTYISDQSPNGSSQYSTQNNASHTQNSDPQQSKQDNQDYNYGNYYNYNMPPYGPPPAQGYGYPQHPPPYDMMGGYPPQPQQPQYNYGYQGYAPPPPQPHYPPPAPQGYDYNAPPPTPPMYGGYHQPYPPPGQYAPPPPQGIYPPSSAPPNQAPPYTDYQQYPQVNNAPPPAPYYQNS